MPELNCQPNRRHDAGALELINCYDASAFALPAQFTFGNAPRNVLRGPKFVSTDLSLMKNIPLGGRLRFQIRAEIFNVFNTVNYGNPNASFGAAGVRPHYDRRGDAPGAARRQAALLTTCEEQP